MRGWSKLVPGRQRLPLPWPCLMAVVGMLCAERKPWVAVALTVGYICCLRPGDLDQLSHQQLVCPTVRAGPSAEDRVGKTGLQGEAVMIDRCAWLHQRLLQLSRLSKRPCDRLWPFESGTLHAEFMTCVRRLRLGALGASLYSIRHGGASDDLLCANDAASPR